MKKRRGEIVLSALFVVVGIAAVAIIQMQKSSALSNTGATTFKTFPTVYGVLLIILSAANLALSLLAAYKEDHTQKQEQNAVQETAQENNSVTYLRVAAMFLLTLVFTLLLKRVNFGLLAFVFLFLSFFVLGRKRISVNLVVSLVGSGLIYVIFRVLLKLPL